MTVKELKQAIADLPDQMDVFLEEMETGFQFGLVNSAVVQEINFKEDPYGEILSREKVLVLKEV